ncbi:hypothetical protein ACJIZ3_022231 [Penstemon smallii]|uniref:Uncharacterized protein n=1 Tax=Penstemon smallii TaxID=265156 RepID=A0ABD3SNN2_9LAMI
MCDCILPPLYSFRIHKLGFTTYSKPPKLENGIILQSKSKRSSITLHSTRNQDAIPFPSGDHEYENLEYVLMEKEKSAEFQLGGDRRSKNDEQRTDKPAWFSGNDESPPGNESVKGLDTKFNELEKQSDQEAVAVQVISIRSAFSLGFVSQLWVNTSSWIVVVVEVRPNLLSGDFERFLLKAISQVGDVILVEDENVIENDFKFAGLESLVGYTVVTPSRRTMGKVSTYALFVEDVLEILSDTIVVHEVAALHIQRLTKGFWDGQIIGNSIKEFEQQLDPSGQQVHADYRERRHKNLSSRKPGPKIRKRKVRDDWELPMDYF